MKILKNVIGTAGTRDHAHHIIPWAKLDKDIVQKAANSSGGFNMNEALNDIPRSPSLHQTVHNLYNDRINEVLDSLHYEGMPEDEAYDTLTDFIDYLTDLLENNPTLNSGEIAALINF